MTPADTTAETPVLIRLNTRRLFGWGSAVGLLALICLGIFALLWAYGAPVSVIAVAALASVLLGTFCTYLIGVAYKKPVALRMDPAGISGFYVDPARWQDIAEIGLWHDNKQRAYLGFALHDPLLFFDCQTPLRRLITWSNGRATRFHLVVPHTSLADADPTALLATAQAFHAAARR